MSRQDKKTGERKKEEKGMIRAGIIGSTGYAGGELVRILLGHKDVEIKWYGSRSYIDKKYASVYQNMFQLVDDVCKDDNMEQLAKEVDVIFTATPQGLCASLVNDEILSKVKVIDLSADFRIKDVKTYEEWYKIEHKSPQYIDEAVYGLCEINREKVKQARIVANPGCYPTCSTLSIYPLLKEDLIDGNTIIIDAKSELPEQEEERKWTTSTARLMKISSIRRCRPPPHTGDRGAAFLCSRLPDHPELHPASCSDEPRHSRNGICIPEKRCDLRRG